MPKLPNWSCLLVLIHADPMALVLLTLWTGRVEISHSQATFRLSPGGTEGEGIAWSSDGTGALQGCRMIIYVELAWEDTGFHFVF